MRLFDSDPTRYRSLLEIARGGMGSVELVVRDHGHFESLHALKRLHRELRSEPETRAMFLDEARIAGLIRHPNVVSVTDIGEDEDGPYIVMDYVDGVPLNRLLSRASRDRRLPLACALEIMRQVAVGLEAAHALTDAAGKPLHVVHRDISPQNILIGFDGFVRVTDFGIAKAMGRSAKTQTGILKGKIGYLAPEALRFEESDHRSDLFSFGVVLFECLTQRRLYRSADGLQSARDILNAPPPDLGEELEDAPDALVELVFSLLAKDAEHRPRSAGEVETTLQEILADVTLDVPMPPLSELMRERFGDERAVWQREIEQARASARGRIRSRRLLWAGAATLLTAVSLTAVALRTGHDSESGVAEVRFAAPSASTPADIAPIAPDAGVPDAEVDAGVVDEPAPRRRRRRARPESMSGAPMWDWQ